MEWNRPDWQDLRGGADHRGSAEWGDWVMCETVSENFSSHLHKHTYSNANLRKEFVFYFTSALLYSCTFQCRYKFKQFLQTQNTIYHTFSLSLSVSSSLRWISGTWICSLTLSTRNTWSFTHRWRLVRGGPFCALFHLSHSICLQIFSF